MKVTPEQSEQVQRILFDNGYKWFSGDNEIALTENQYIEFYKDPYFREETPTLGWLTDEQFERSISPELTFSQFMELYGKEEKK